MNILENRGLSSSPCYILTNKDAETLNAFKALHGNRKINPIKVKKLVEAFKNNEFIPPILVSIPSGEITEGNHRFAAAIECLNRDIPFILYVFPYEDQTALATARQINNTQTKWNGEDKLHSYCVEGKESYLRLREFIQSYQHVDLAIRRALNILTNGRTLASLTSAFNSGNLNISQKDLEYGKCVMTKLIELSHVIGQDAFNADNIALFISYYSWIQQNPKRFMKLRLNLSKYVRSNGWICPRKREGWQELYRLLTSRIK